MENRKYSAEHIKEWCNDHYPQVDETSDNVELEHHFRNVIIEGSMYFDKYPLSTNRTLFHLKPKNRYKRYFTNRAKADALGADNFHFLCSNGGSKYTNEYQYATLLCDEVKDEVVGKSVKLLKQYGLQVF